MMKKLLCTFLFAIIAIGNINAQFGSVSGGSPLQVIPTTSTAPPTNTPTTADGTDFGIVPLLGTSQQTYTFTSTVSAALLVQVQNITGPDAGEFSQNNPSPSSITGIGATSSFSVNFNPTTSGTKTAIIEVRVVQPPFFGSPESFFFTITGTSPPPAPSIKVTGDDSLTITNGSSDPSPGDNTHFGSAVSNVESVTRQFTIENDGTADLVINDIINAFGSSDFSIVLGGISFPLTIPASNSVSFNITFSPTSPASPPPVEIAAFIFIDAAIDTYDFFYEVEGEGVPAAPNMEVSGNTVVIADGDNSPTPSDHTDFENVDINTAGGFSRTFTIENTGSSNLILTSLSPIVNITGPNAADFSVTSNPSTPITPGNTTTFIVKFEPSTVGLKQANIVINNNTTNGKNPYNFAIQGNAIDVNVSSPLLITQYYDGLSNNQWIEVKNISGITLTAGVYNLALYTNTSARDGIINTTPPQAFEPIVGAAGSIAPNEVILFKNPAATVPSAGNLGTAHVISSLVSTFTGDDVVLISTSTGINCFNNRIDIVGVVAASGGAPPNWGADRGFAKGCGTTLVPQLVYNSANFIELTREEVINANSDSNLALGTHRAGTTTWSGSAWSNGISDRTRDAIMNGSYTALDGSFSACNLTIAGNVDFNNNTTNYVEVSKSLSITGTLTVGDQESLYTVNASTPGDPVSITGSITKIETTTQLTDAGDYTYWASPVVGQNISSVFSSPTYNQGRIYYWDQSVVNADGLGGNQALGEWIAASGLTMEAGKGYISQGPVGISNATSSVNFSGTPHTGTVDLVGGNDIVYNPGVNLEDDLNLIGNPYPSGIDADLFINQGDNNLSLTGTLWFWTHSTPNNGNTTGEQYIYSDYASYNLAGGIASANGGATPGQYIGSGQGFMVQAKSPTNKKVSFTDEMRKKSENTQFFRGTNTKKSSLEEKDRVWLNVESNKGGAFSQILVGFFENATDGKDYGYDGIKISENWVNLYSKIDTLKYGIQGLSSFSSDKQVPLAFQTYIDEVDISYTIGIERFEGALRDNDIYLVDNELNVTHDLKQGDYSFTAATGSHDDRFTLQFTKTTLGVDDLDLNNDFVIVNEENSLLVKSKSIVSELKMYDITGRLLVNMLPNESEFRINTNSIRKGTVLILNTTFENGTELSKKAIKY